MYPLAHEWRVAERLHIARELHDSLGHHLVALRLYLDAAVKLTCSTPGAAPVARAQEIACAMVGDVRRIVGSMRRQRPIDFAAALHRLVDGISQPTVILSMPPALRIDSAAHAHVLLRAVQEAITNALRHANASTVWVDLAADNGGIRLTIRDDGDGVTTVRFGNGLIGMRERVTQLGGAMRIGSRPGRGFSLCMRLPLATGAAA
jgi:signal transduction histidine kinase